MSSYFEEDVSLRPEIVAGLFREGQIVTVAGRFNVGKTPLLADLAVHIINGLPWCGRETVKRPVIHFDYESSDPSFRRNYKNISNTLGVNPPRVPEDLEPYVYSAKFNTDAMTKASSNYLMLELLEECLKRKPTALIMLDPIEMGFSIDLLKGGMITALYKKFRELISKYEQAAFFNTHNLRKEDRRATQQPNLLLNPHGWLQEISGNMNLINRSDVRLGIDKYKEGIVINGIRRGEEMHPLLLMPKDDDPENLGGFKRVVSCAADLPNVLTETQVKYWKELPKHFMFIDHANNGIPKSSLSRLCHRSLSLGIMIQAPDSEYVKTV